MILFLWGALSDERMGLSFIYAAGSAYTYKGYADRIPDIISYGSVTTI
jgi:ABC-type maltose transport system permease subunit